mmetsp:Transcript_23722/g.58968  ORF Transcript_23722/g.58968 Transcript_23722/m.58968 type:complete len:86 (+) Transcript_23722:373-630(+)
MANFKAIRKNHSRVLKLPSVQQRHRLVDGCRAIKIDDLDILGLPYAMAAVLRLLMDERVEPSVEKGNVVCLDDVETNAAALDRSQ